MIIHTPPAVNLESVNTIQAQSPGEHSYLLRVSTTDDSHPLLDYLRHHHQHNTLPEDHPGVMHVAISEEPTHGQPGYSLTIAVKPPPGFTDLDIAFERLANAWQTAETEQASLDSQQTVIHAWHTAMANLNKFVTDVSNAPAFDDTPEGIADLFDYIHEQIALQNETEPDSDPPR